MMGIFGVFLVAALDFLGEVCYNVRCGAVFGGYVLKKRF